MSRADLSPPGYRRLSTGLDRLEQWSANASQVDRNAVYKALFAVSNGSVYRVYSVLRRPAPTHGLVVLVRDDLVIRVGLPTPETFAIEYIGPPGR